MHDPNACLALLLDAPLQSWGYQSKFDRRTSFSQPTRSGVLGIICAAMGIDRADSAKLAEFTNLKLKIFTFEQNGRLVDFHTVGGGWDRSDKKQKRNIVPTADGKVGNTVVTRREYLQSAKFGIVVCGPRNQLEEIAQALGNPQWGVWLGRKSCIPAAPIMQGVFDSEENALQHLCARTECSSQSRTCIEVDSFEEGTDTLMDNPLDFATRQFAPRRVAVT